MTFEEHLNKIKKFKRYTFSRWGDGEWLCIIGKNGSNCDGHFYFPEMGKALREVLASKPNYIIGLQGLAKRHMPEIIEEYTAKYNLEWVNSDIFHNANASGRIKALFKALENREVLLVGGNHLKEFNKDWKFIEVPRVNCWNAYDKTKEKLSNYFDRVESGQKPVVLFCASMMSNVLIDDFHNLASNYQIDATLIDFGSVLDPYVGVKSRTYHRKMNI